MNGPYFPNTDTTIVLLNAKKILQISGTTKNAFKAYTHRCTECSKCKVGFISSKQSMWQKCDELFRTTPHWKQKSLMTHKYWIHMSCHVNERAISVLKMIWIGNCMWGHWWTFKFWHFQEIFYNDNVKIKNYLKCSNKI